MRWIRILQRDGHTTFMFSSATFLSKLLNALVASIRSISSDSSLSKAFLMRVNGEFYSAFLSNVKHLQIVTRIKIDFTRKSINKILNSTDLEINRNF